MLLFATVASFNEYTATNFTSKLLPENILITTN